MHLLVFRYCRVVLVRTWAPIILEQIIEQHAPQAVHIEFRGDIEENECLKNGYNGSL
jgi:hypothetical protein